MAFSKSFPKPNKTGTYTTWEEVSISEAEEREAEARARVQNVKVLKESITDAKSLMKENQLKDYQTDVVTLAVALFEKRASHEIYWKENKAKEKFDKMFK